MSLANDSILVKRTCGVAICGVKPTRRGFCRKHYTRFMRHGDALVVLPSQKPWTHGRSAYANGRCRCEVCTAANREYVRGERLRNPEVYKERIRRRNASEASKAYKRGWYANNKERVREYHKNYYWANPEKAREKQRRFRSTPHGELATAAARLARRAREAQAPGFATSQQIQARIEYYGGRCYLCGAKANTIDHVKPLIANGSNWPANLRPACKPCNFSKGGRWTQC